MTAPLDVPSITAARLQEVEALFNNVQALVKLGIWEWDIHADSLTWSDETYRIYGFEPQAFKASYQAFTACLHPDDLARVESVIGNALATLQTYVLDHRIIRPDGEVRLLHSQGRVVCDAEGRPVRMFGTAQDITEARRAQKELAQSNAILRAQQEASAEGILVVDEHRRVISANRRFVEIWGIPVELMGTANDSLLIDHVMTKVASPADFVAKVEHQYRHMSEPSHDEIALLDGRVLERYSSPAVTASGENFGLIWFFRDITERKRMEAELQTQNEQLQELDRLKVTFVNAVSHELRTPITSILGYADFLEEVLDLPPEAPAMEFVSEVRKGARRLRALVADLMDFTLIEAGAFKLILAPGDFGAKVRDVAASLRPQVEKAKLSLEVVLPETPVIMQMDGDRIGQVLSNLVVNAVKFTLPGGAICVCVAVENGQVHCEVKDSGVGIADADMPKLFQRYMMLEGGLRRGGTGLGLNISKALVEAHGGAIGVSSVPGEGSIFWFTLPTSAPEARKQPSS